MSGQEESRYPQIGDPQKIEVNANRSDIFAGKDISKVIGLRPDFFSITPGKFFIFAAQKPAYQSFRTVSVEGGGI